MNGYLDVSPDGFVKAVVEAAKTYTDEVVEQVEGGIDRIADETLKEVRRLSPVNKGKKYKDRKYKQKWRIEKKRVHGAYKIVVHNEQYRLIHLLELGHLNSTGVKRKKLEGYPENFKAKEGELTKAIVHVKTAQENAEAKVKRMIKEYTNGT